MTVDKYKNKINSVWDGIDKDTKHQVNTIRMNVF